MLKTVKAKRAIAHPHIKKDDTVVVLSGSDSKPRKKTGRVLQVNPDKGMAYVEGINYVKRHQKPSKKIGKGGIIQKEGPIAISSLGLLCGKCNKVTRAKIVAHGDETSRVCVLCEEPLGRK